MNVSDPEDINQRTNQNKRWFHGIINLFNDNMSKILISVSWHVKNDLRYRTPYLPKIDHRNLEKSTFSKKNFEKILKVQKFQWSRSGRNFCRQGRIPKGNKFPNFQSWNIPSKTRKVMIIRSCATFVQKMHVCATWWLLTLPVNTKFK